MSILEITMENECINRLLSGGFKSKNLYHIFGAEGSGKTTFGLYLAYLVAKKGFKIFYLSSTRNFNLIRLKQIAGDSFLDISQLIFVQNPKNFLEQDKIVNKLENFITEKFKLIVIDDIVSLMKEKSKIDSKRLLKSRMLSRQLALLKNISRNYDIISVILNQSSINKDEDSGELKNVPFYKAVVTFYSDFDLEIIQSQENSLSNRKLKRIKPENQDISNICKFQLDNKGII